MKIGLLSDTHSHMDEAILRHLTGCDEIWHAGDIGSLEITDKLSAIAPVRAVYGNIDDHQVRSEFPEDLFFTVNKLSVYITHIGGYPGKYVPRVRPLLLEHKPDLFICGHSHILKIMPDKKNDLIHINPGACGHHGFHAIRTLVRFRIEAGKLHDVEVVELGKRGSLG